MRSYHRASSSMPLKDAGLVEFAAEDQDTLAVLTEALAEFSASDASPLAMRYDEDRKLLNLMSKLQRRLPSEAALRARCRIGYDSKEDSSGEAEKDGWIPLAELFGEVGGTSIADYILHRAYTLYLQPIVQTNGSIVGYEFLTRSLPEQAPFRPAELFETARKIGQHSFLDRAARLLAVRMGAAHLAPGMLRFVNFLPSSLHQPDACLKCIFDAMRETGTDPRDCVFEVMESEPLDDPRLPDVFSVYRKEGVRVALDDVGSGFATLDVVERLQPDYVKMDRRWVSRCDQDTDKQRYIDRLLERVSRFNGVVLAEGVERLEEWNYLKQAGVPLFQGYLFGRAAPVPIPAPAAVL
ncbi:EAL domain-containing protein [Cohnella terricola]|nr:EAL domain-containing protein [Cohnella terricola]